MASQLAKQYFFFLGALFFAMARLDTALALSPASNSHNILVLSSLFKGQLLFITRFKKRDDYVYQYPLSSLDVSGHRLNTAGASSPVSLRTKWSVLGTAAHDAIVTSAIVANAPKHEVAFLVTRNWRGDTATSFFDFSKADHFDLTALSWDGTVWLSSGSFDKTYYSLKTNGSLALGKYQLGYDGNEPTSDLVDSNMANLKVPYLAVCLKGKDTVLLSKGSCSKVAQWKVTAGMVVMDRFYLFSQEAVYAFDVKAFDTPETEVKLDHCSRNVFFGEPDNLTYKSSGALSTKKSTVWIIVGVVVGILILIAIIISAVLLCNLSSKSKKKPKKSASLSGTTKSRGNVSAKSDFPKSGIKKPLKRKSSDQKLVNLHVPTKHPMCNKYGKDSHAKANKHRMN